MRRGTGLHRRQGNLTPVWWPVNWLGRSDWQSAPTLSGSGAALGARREAPPRRIGGRGPRSGVRAAGPLRSSEFRYARSRQSVPQLAAGTSFFRADSPSIPEPACLVRLWDRSPAFSRFAPPAPDRRRRRLESRAAPGSAASDFSRIAATATRGVESWRGRGSRAAAAEDATTHHRRPPCGSRNVVLGTSVCERVICVTVLVYTIRVFVRRLRVSLGYFGEGRSLESSAGTVPEQKTEMPPDGPWVGARSSARRPTGQPNRLPGALCDTR